jgi:hypothetical protein
MPLKLTTIKELHHEKEKGEDDGQCESGLPTLRDISRCCEQSPAKVLSVRSFKG